MKYISCKNIVLAIIISIFSSFRSIAQVVPDNTLGAESSTIRSIDNLKDAIEGGAIRKDNLFHSFQEFGIPEGSRVDFVNPAGIANIFSRVTGTNISKIFGILGVNGTANLFLMNPNGIIFGENAAINIGGSFLATTAETIEFNNSSQFSTIAPNKPILTIDFPIGLGMDSSSGDITINDRGHNLIFSGAEIIPTVRSSVSPGLEASLGKNLAFIGKQVNLDGGVLIAENGQIELAGIRQGFVNLDLDFWKFDYSNVSNFGSVNLSNTSLVDASSLSNFTSSSSGGGIKITGQNITTKDESVIVIQNESSNEPGNIELNATDSISISKVEIDPVAETPGGIISETLGKGKGSDIQINARVINLSEGGSIITKTLGREKAGNISIQASNKLDLIGVSILDTPPVASNITSAAFPIGKTGSISITTPLLTLQDGGTITNFALGQAIGDDIIVNTDNLLISGTDASKIYASSISTNSSGVSQGANIFINATNVEIKEGAAIAATTFDFAIPGNVNLNVSDSLRIEGFDFQTQNPSTIVSTILIQDETLQEAFTLVSAEIPANATIGDSGNVSIQTSKLFILDKGIVSVLNQGSGNAGNLEINADSISLDESAQISASTLSGEGGDIYLNVDGLLELSERSQITATAGGTGNGGNITINADNIVGFNNSDITANAVAGNGGNIEINSNVILGIKQSESFTPNSDITADSELGIDGTVNINSPESNADDEIVLAPIRQTDTPLEIFQDICAPSIANKGKLRIIDLSAEETPYNYLDRNDKYSLAIEQIEQGAKLNEALETIQSSWQPGDPIVEPNAVKVGADGSQVLVASNEELQGQVSTPYGCSSKKN